MSWAVKVTIEAHEMGRAPGAALGQEPGLVLRTYVYSPPLCRGENIAAAWARLEAEVHENFLSRLEPTTRADS